MLSYMLDRQGYLLVNRAVVGGDVTDFEYSPKPEYDGPFRVVNVPDERALLVAWFEHMRRARPGVYVTYNGDFFDWPFLEARAAKHGLEMREQVGFSLAGKPECLAKAAVHMDCMHWVNRDSYLPQGSRGLKVCACWVGCVLRAAAAVWVFCARALCVLCARARVFFCAAAAGRQSDSTRL